uniref:DDE Tnp4 domain-containing protein n=1 Tax=Oncorhynchus kisutch TaxID=8019 RepID=A0A8C7KNI3_ONCKI
VALSYLKIVVDLAYKRPARRVLVDRSNPLNYFDEIALRPLSYVQYKGNALEIISLLEPRLSSLSQRGRPLPNSLQVLVTLRFLAFGIFHRETGDLCGASEATVCRIVQGLQGVIACIDGCHVPIKCPPTPDAEEYRNRKNWFSNVQGVCTPNLEFLNVVALWKLATHDSRIFLNSSLCAQFQRGQHSGLQLGDSGYVQSNFLFTPYINPTTAEQQRYDRAHSCTRAMVKHMFGVRTNRFQCSCNTLRFKPRRCYMVSIATAVLHNYLKHHCCPPMEDQDQADVPIAEAGNDQQGLAHRDAFTLQHFN